MTSKQYITSLTSNKDGISGKDVPQTACPDVIDGLCEVIADKDQVISAREKRIESMRRQILWLQRKVFGRSSEKLHQDDPRQLHFDFGEEETVAPLSSEELKEAEKQVGKTGEKVRKETEARRNAERQSRSRKGCKYRIPADIERRESEPRYPEGYNPETMVVIGWDCSEYLEMEKAKPFVRVDKRAICKLRNSKPTDAHTTIYEAEPAQNCIPGCKAGNSLMAQLVTDKFCHHMPEYRQAKRLSSMGLNIPTSSINHWMHSLASVLAPIYELQTKLVFTSKYQHLDESTIPVNDVKGKTRKGYIWSDVDGMCLYGMAFFYEKGSRGGKVLYPKLLERAGHKTSIQSDGFIVYTNIEKRKIPDIISLYCMAHARRKFEAIKDVPEAAKILEYIQLLYLIEANLKYRKASFDEIRRERQEKAVPILDFIKKMLDTFRTVDTPAGALADACNYAIARWEGLCRYCEEGYYDIDNNAVERSIRPLTLGRKNWLFVDSDDSAVDTAIYMTLAGSCNLLGIKPYEYFMEILPKIKSDMTEEEYTELLPYKVAEKMKRGTPTN